MRYQVIVTGYPMQDFTVIESAIDYAARHVYLPQDKGKKAKKALEAETPVAYSYGFKDVVIIPVKEEKK